MLNGTWRVCAMVVLGLVLSTHSVQSQVRSQYRDYQLGSDLVSVAAPAKVAATEARTRASQDRVANKAVFRP